MSDGVKFIFKTLIKVPVYIAVAFFVFNIFAFSLTYFRLMGLSHVVLQTAVENNHIPSSELNTLNGYLDSITDTGVVGDASVVLQDKEGRNEIATNRRQYGRPLTVGVTAQYKFIWPLSPKDQLVDPSSGFDGLHGSGFSGYASGGTLEQRRKDIEDNEDNNIRIEYTVPGLKYYPDMAR